MLPYLGWTCFATTLINCSLFDNNPAVVQSAHKYAQVSREETPDISRANSLHTRNKTAPAEFGRRDFTGALPASGGIQYSNSPILGPNAPQDSRGSWNNRLSEPGHQLHQQQQPPQQQYPWQQQQQQQQPWIQAQTVGSTPFGESQLHRRSATDVDRERLDRDRRMTRRTTDDEVVSFDVHPDSGHLAVPAPQQAEKPERTSNSGIFGRVQSSISLAIATPSVFAVPTPPQVR